MYETAEKQKLIKKEVTKLKKAFKDLDDIIKKNAEKLIENAAWMAISLDELKHEIDITGYTENYMNGANQSGVKDSTYVRTYNTMIKNYNATIKLLLDQLPQTETHTGDKLAQFLLKK
ncbi:hypothetical protein [Pectinatus frisingensis]|uniref:hypothetical protein n=1 Tax=Pectinatus frisingensis TaxID=865 RepID=UPI0018C7F56E|nr:hypothetical protein [Pectinatus frisingensis]